MPPVEAANWSKGGCPVAALPHACPVSNSPLNI